VINFSAAPDIKVGRGSQCEVRITDVSVSRHHSTFEMVKHTDAKMYLRVVDESSKFGTLVFVDKPLQLTQNNKIFLQVGRSIL
jgi:hypothetical protein